MSIVRPACRIMAALVAVNLIGCATQDTPRGARNEAKQEQLEQMEKAGQRNDDRPVRAQ